jgi:hypothetical protein
MEEMMTETKRIVLTGKDIYEMIDKDKAHQMLMSLAENTPAVAMVTVAAIMATLVASNNSDPTEAQLTLEELHRLSAEIVQNVLKAMRNGELKLDTPTWGQTKWGH